ncbi:MAG: hypothetical protein PWP51_1422 [Clostridiales bacterium]|nr:hypothetical protein [Clostridiales bacterium]MDN5298869.1 hypothetical protein [Clostridiales bacterium]
MKKLLILGLVTTTLLSGAVFAGTEETADNTPLRPERPRIEQFDGERQGDDRTIEVRRKSDGERRTQVLTEAFETYYPEALDTYTALEAEHKAFHESRDALRETAMAAEKQAYQEIVDALLSGEMDREAARAAIEDLRGAGAETRESLKAIFDEKREALEADKTINDALRDTLRALLTAETVDEAAVQNALDEVIAQLQSHIALDEKYAAMADAVMVP